MHIRVSGPSLSDGQGNRYRGVCEVDDDLGAGWVKLGLAEKLTKKEVDELTADSEQPKTATRTASRTAAKRTGRAAGAKKAAAPKEPAKPGDGTGDGAGGEQK